MTLALRARRFTQMALSQLVNVMQSSRSDVARVAAAREILDRGWGRPASTMDIIHSMDKDALLAVARRIADKRIAELPAEQPKLVLEASSDDELVAVENKKSA